MRRLILTITLIIASFSLYGENSPKIYLATIGPGDELFLRWGHFAIVVDYDNKKDRLYDYGNFSFQQDDFVPNFIKGVMTYFKYRKSADYELTGYKVANRTITLQELNLTDEQVDIYIQKLRNEVTPQNRNYQYDHYYNNCVSQMSDFLDELTDGAFYEGTDRLTGRSFRDYSRDYISSNYLYNNLIMFVLGSKVEFNTTVKESLFLPDNTRDRAAEVFIEDGAGGLKPLVKSTTILYESIGRDPVIVNAKPKTLLNFIIGALIATLFLFLRRFRHVLTVSSIVMGVLIGLGGSVLFFMSFFTGHYYIHNNWNLIMVNPFGFILLISGIMQLSSRLNKKAIRLSTIYIDITLWATVVMIVLKSIGLINQDNGEIIAFITPLLIVNSSFYNLFFNQLGRFNKLSDKPLSSSAASNRDSLEDNITTE